MSDHISAEPERHAADPFEFTGEIDHAQYHNVAGDPKGDPFGVVDGYEVYTFGKPGVVPEDLFVVELPEDEDVHSRMWVFTGDHGLMHLIGYYRHRFGPTNPEPPERGAHDCCFKITREHGLTEENCPETVSDVVARVADAPVIMPNEDPDETEN